MEIIVMTKQQKRVWPGSRQVSSRTLLPDSTMRPHCASSLLKIGHVTFQLWVYKCDDEKSLRLLYYEKLTQLWALDKLAAPAPR